MDLRSTNMSKLQKRIDMKVLVNLVIFFLAVPCIGQVSLKKKNESCAGLKDGSIEVVMDSIDGPFEYIWQDLTNQVMMPDTTSGIYNLAPGMYSVTVIVSGTCMDTKSAAIWPGKSVSLSVSSRHISHTPTPIPCGIRPEMTFLLTAQAFGGNPPYYFSWAKGGNKDGTATKQVTAKDFEENIAVIDSLGCTEFLTWTYHTLVKICPMDPNDISGPDGYDTSKWISVDDELDYTIRFENDPIFATAASSVVLVTLPIDDDVDPFSFRLGTIGFGNQIIEIPSNKTSYQQRLDFSETIGYMVDVTAGLDIPNNRFFWLLETIDPLTGQPPTDPFAGFLPVNDTLTGSGEGFINFTCKPKSATPTGEYIEKQASIIFDANDPILTNTWTNKVDAVGPTVIPGMMPDTFHTNLIPFSWVANDDPGGCGAQYTQIMLSLDGNDFESNGYILDTNQTTIELDWDTKYYYRITSTDFVGNQEIPAYDSFYIIPERSIQFLTPDEDVYCIGDTLWLDMILTSIPDIDLAYSLDSGDTFLPLAVNLNTFPYGIRLDSTFFYPHILLRARNQTNNLEEISDPFSVNGLPVLEVSGTVSGCDNEILFVEAEGANEYHWWPDNIMGTPFNRYTNVYAGISQYAYVSGTDVFGCATIDSVYLNVSPSSLDTLSTPLCEGDSIFLNGEWISEEGFYTTTYVSSVNCDSIVVKDVHFATPCIWSHGPYVYVDKDAAGANDGSSWNDAFNELTDAVYVAGRYENVQEIWVAEGVYKPHATRRDTSFILSDSIRIYGGFLGIETTRDGRTTNAALVKISGDINVPGTLTDNSYHTLRLLPSCDSCIIDGVTITYGRADEPTNQNDLGAGVVNGGKSFFFNVVFEHNYATTYGAAIYNHGAPAELVLRNCLFRLNTSGLARDILNSSGATLKFEGVNGVHY